MTTARVKSSLQHVVAMVGAVVMSLLFVAVPTAEAASVEPVEHDGNPTCVDFQPEGEDWAEFKVEGAADGGATEAVDSGTYQDPDGPLEVTIAVTDTDDGQVFDWSANLDVDAVFAKGGNGGNLYQYHPNETTSDVGLHAPENASGQFAELSHISFCYEAPVQDTDPAVISLDVDKVNDADGDDDFTDSEEAVAPGAAVDFRVTITNGSAVAVDLSSATDTFSTDDGTTTLDLFEECDNLSDDTVLAAGESVTCTFAVADYAPAAGASLVNTVTVTGHEDDNSDNTDTAQDDSTVTTPAEDVLSDGEDNDTGDEVVDVENPDIILTKVALTNPDAQGNHTVTYAPNDGDDETISYRYTIINTGDVTLTGITLTDDVLGTIALPTTTLAPDAAITVNAMHTVTAADAAAGEVVNVAITTGTSPEGDQVQATAEERVLVERVLGISLERDDDGVQAAADDSVRADDSVQVAADADELARTGSDPVGWATLAIGLLIAGGVALLATRSRRATA